MSVETLIPIATSMGGGFFAGIVAGYFVKKIIKILMFTTGGVVGLLLYLQHQQLISVNQERLEASVTLALTTLSSSFDKMTQIGDMSSLEIPLAGGLLAGLAIGFVKG